MARARNIKPAVMDNEDLAELEPLTRLLFIYLWMLADREGRLEDRPKRIGAQAFAYDRYIDITKMLDDLQSKSFIKRYTVKDIACIQIINFSKHQSPHGTEKDSKLPDSQGKFVVHVRGKNDYSTGKVTFLDSLLTVNQQNANALIPDLLNPDPLIPDSLIHSVAKATGGEPPFSIDQSFKKISEKASTSEMIFNYGVPLLVNTGTEEKHARSFLGLLIKSHGEEALIDALHGCGKAKPLQPLEWLAAALPPHSSVPRLNAQERLEASNAAVVNRFLMKDKQVSV